VLHRYCTHGHNGSCQQIYRISRVSRPVHLSRGTGETHTHKKVTTVMCETDMFASFRVIQVLYRMTKIKGLIHVDVLLKLLRPDVTHFIQNSKL
jgi:hypothetical protein